MIIPDRIVTTTCPYCGVGCNLELHVKDDFIFKVTSPFDSPVNHGNLCVKGRFGYDYIYHPKRVTTPLIRKTRQEAGKRTQAFDLAEWREVSWNEALDYVADRLVEIYQRDGSDAMSVYCCAKATNEDNYLLQKMFRAIFRTNNVDHCTRLCHAGSVVALQQAVGSSAMSNTASQVIQNDVFIVTGSNTSENHPIIALQMKEAVEKYGAKMIVVDPRRIELVDFAELWLPLKPGTNVPVFSAMAHVIVKENLVNHEFVSNRTEGYQEFVESLEKFTPEYAEQLSGVPAEDIRKAARMYATAKNGAIYWGMGISQLSHGTASALALIHLAFLTGHVGRDGTGLNPLRGQNNVQGASDMGAMPFHYPGYMRVDNEDNAKKWEAAWNIEPNGLSRKLGLTTTEILSHAHEGGVRALFIMGENPMMSEPNLNETRKHMEQLEFLIAQDIFINESGAFADVFLPATPFAEKMGHFQIQIGACNACAPRINHADSPDPTGKLFVTSHFASNRDLGGLPPNGIIPIPNKFCVRWRASIKIMRVSPINASKKLDFNIPCQICIIPARRLSSKNPSRADAANSMCWIMCRSWKKPTMNILSS